MKIKLDLDGFSTSYKPGDYAVCSVYMITIDCIVLFRLIGSGRENWREILPQLKGNNLRCNIYISAGNIIEALPFQLYYNISLFLKLRQQRMNEQTEKNTKKKIKSHAPEWPESERTSLLQWKVSSNRVEQK